jgi:hypothetical protein
MARPVTEPRNWPYSWYVCLCVSVEAFHIFRHDSARSAPSVTANTSLWLVSVRYYTKYIEHKFLTLRTGKHDRGSHTKYTYLQKTKAHVSRVSCNEPLRATEGNGNDALLSFTTITDDQISAISTCTDVVITFYIKRYQPTHRRRIYESLYT